MLLPLPKLLLLLPLLHLLLLPKLPVPGADSPHQGPASHIRDQTPTPGTSLPHQGPVSYSRGQNPEVPHNTAQASKLPYTASKLPYTWPPL